MGVLLIYGARKPQARALALVIAGASKAILITLVLSHGGRFLAYQAGIAVFVDLVWVAVFASYLLGVRRMPKADPKIGTMVGTA